jgi:hypothetical protein
MRWFYCYLEILASPDRYRQESFFETHRLYGFRWRFFMAEQRHTGNKRNTLRRYDERKHNTTA